jgi:hypothetical protein
MFQRIFSYACVQSVQSEECVINNTALFFIFLQISAMGTFYSNFFHSAKIKVPLLNDSLSLLQFHICIINESDVEITMIKVSYNTMVFNAKIIILVQMHFVSDVDVRSLFKRGRTDTLSL